MATAASQKNISSKLKRSNSNQTCVDICKYLFDYTVMYVSTKTLMQYSTLFSTFAAKPKIMYISLPPSNIIGMYIMY